LLKLMVLFLRSPDRSILDFRSYALEKRARDQLPIGGGVVHALKIKTNIQSTDGESRLVHLL
jgi:bifunctional DNase/RNase